MEHRKQQTNDLVERRTFNIEHRATADGVKKIGGMAAVYDTPTNMGWYVEMIKPGFFDGIRTGSTACLKNHDPNLVLGRTANNTLKLTFSAAGLDYESTVPNTTIGADTYEEVRSGYIYQSSFAFTVAEQTWRQAQPSEFSGVFPQDIIEKLTYGGVIDVRELTKGAELYDVSPVTYPAYDATSATSRNESPLFEIRNKFLGISETGNSPTIKGEDLLKAIEKQKTADEERMKITVEVEVEINEPETPEIPDGETPTETDAELYARQLQVNTNRLRIAEAVRMQYSNI